MRKTWLTKCFGYSPIRPPAKHYKLLSKTYPNGITNGIDELDKGTDFVQYFATESEAEQWATSSGYDYAGKITKQSNPWI